MTDRQIQAELSSIESRIDQVASVMEETAPGHVGYLQGTPWGSEGDHSRYESAQSERRGLVGRRDELVQEVARRKAGSGGSQPASAFVNSYGEATRRYITSPSYERAQREQQRRIMSLLGGR